MIRIYKGDIPDGLARFGERHSRELCAAYDADPEAYRAGERRMQFHETTYASPTVKAALETCHRGKCCYCETRFDDHRPFAYSCVEHWRPKSSWRQSRNDVSVRPGYYWLAYNWGNLLLSCVFCNSDNNKNDLFPLADPAARALHHMMRIEEETPEILKPDGNLDPRDHIMFHNDVPVGITSLGRRTIEVLGLDSPKHGPRLRHLDKVRVAHALCTRWESSIDPEKRQKADDARRFLEGAVAPDQPYSAMVATFIEAHPLPNRAIEAD